MSFPRSVKNKITIFPIQSIPLVKNEACRVKDVSGKTGQYRSLLVRNLPSGYDEESLKILLEKLFSNEPPADMMAEMMATLATKKDSCPRSWTEEILSLEEARDLPSAVTSVRIASPSIENYATMSFPYAIVDFANSRMASLALKFFGTAPFLPGTSHKVNLFPYETWCAPFPVDSYQIYVYGISDDVNSGDLLEYCKTLCPEERICAAHVVMDSRKGLGKNLGFGFLRLDNEDAADRALMFFQTRITGNGVLIRRTYQPPPNRLRQPISCSTSVFLANLPPDLLKDDLVDIFSLFGEVRSTIIHPVKHIAFLEFRKRENALAAITHMQGFRLRNHTLACAWSNRRMATFEEDGLVEDEYILKMEEAYASFQQKCMEPMTGFLRLQGDYICGQADDAKISVISTVSKPQSEKNELSSKDSITKATKKRKYLTKERAYSSKMKQQKNTKDSLANQLFWLSFYAEDGSVSRKKLIDENEQHLCNFS